MRQPPSPMDRIAALEAENARLRARIAAAGALMTQHEPLSTSLRRDARLWRRLNRLTRDLTTP